MSSIAAPLSLAAARPRRGAVLLWRSAGTVLAFMPTAMAVAHRSSPLVLALASLAALLEFWFPVVASLLLALALPSRLPRWGVWILLAGLALACAVILADL